MPQALWNLVINKIVAFISLCLGRENSQWAIKRQGNEFYGGRCKESCDRGINQDVRAKERLSQRCMAMLKNMVVGSRLSQGRKRKSLRRQNSRYSRCCQGHTHRSAPCFLPPSHWSYVHLLCLKPLPHFSSFWNLHDRTKGRGKNPPSS